MRGGRLSCGESVGDERRVHKREVEQVRGLVRRDVVGGALVGAEVSVLILSSGSRAKASA